MTHYTGSSAYAQAYVYDQHTSNATGWDSAGVSASSSQTSAHGLGSEMHAHPSQLHAPTISPKPMSLFEQTMREEDETFYAHFPQARPGANPHWSLNEIHYVDCQSAEAVQYSLDNAWNEPTIAASSASTSSLYPHSTTPTAQYQPSEVAALPTSPFHYDYDYDVNAHYAPLTPQFDNSHQTWAQASVRSPGQEDSHRLVSVPTPAYEHPMPPASPAIQEVHSRLIVPSQPRPQSNNQTEPRRHTYSQSHEVEPFMDFLPSPSSSLVDSPTPSTVSSYLDGPTSPIDDFLDDYPKPSRAATFEPAPSGHWPMGGSTTTNRLLAPAPRYPEHGSEDPHVKSESPGPSTRRHRSTHRARRQMRLHTHSQDYPYSSKQVARPAGWTLDRSPSPHSSSRTSPGLTRRQSDKKPPLACLFCRGRKIACGPPTPGSDDPSCNQCQRRSLKCEYPLESRRGMRKKKGCPSHVNNDGPKVTIARSSKH